MRLFRPILVAVVGLALASYAFDCFAAANTEQAMRCCNSMHCSSYAHHGQDCCKRMPNVRSPFVGASSAHSFLAADSSPTTPPLPRAARCQEYRAAFLRLPVLPFRTKLISISRGGSSEILI